MLTMVMSIAHRITGVGIFIGSLILAWWLLALAHGPDAFARVQDFLGSWFGQIILLGFTWALIHHMIGGLRHLVWDTGRGLDRSTIEWFARGTIAGSVILTILLWVIGYSVW